VTLSHLSARPAPGLPDDPALLGRVRTGDRDALSALYRTHAGEMLALALRLTGSHSEAEEVVQDLFVALPRTLARYQERGRFVPWLKQLTVRLALVRLRAGRRRREAELVEVESFWVSDTTADLELRQALDRLDPDHRAIIVLKVVEGYSHAEIAELLDIRKGTSEVRLHRALQRLRAQLKETA
jgi:RNA polymerase sigma-70 factor (ECF subfamily)